MWKYAHIFKKNSKACIADTISANWKWCKHVCWLRPYAFHHSDVIQMSAVTIEARISHACCDHRLKSEIIIENVFSPALSIFLNITFLKTVFEQFFCTLCYYINCGVYIKKIANFFSNYVWYFSIRLFLNQTTVCVSHQPLSITQHSCTRHFLTSNYYYLLSKIAIFLVYMINT